jgi:hypothetical protein
MIKMISLYLEGDLDALLDRWPVPDGVDLKRRSPRNGHLLLVDDQIQYFDALQDLIARHTLDVEVDANFRAHSFTPQECRTADLLMLYGRCQNGLGFTFPHEGVPDLQGRDRLEMVSHRPLEGRLIALCGTGHLMHTSLVADLRRAGLATGLHTVPTAIEIGDPGPTDHDWVWISSTVDLGTPETKHRFINAFTRHRWQGEHWCSTSHYDGALFIISQPVYRFLRALPDGDTCELDFAPLEVV